MKKIIKNWILTATLSLTAIYPAHACTDFRIIAQDNSVMVTRSMEFALDMKANLRNASRGKSHQSTTPNRKPGLSWTSKYGYLYLDGLNIDAVIDGMNEQGLAFEYLYLPGETEYQPVTEGSDTHALSYIHLGDWVLGNFKDVEEVRKALQNVVVYAEKVPNMGNMIFPLHAIIHDAHGKGIVVEFVGGKMRIHDNNLGVATNSPTYDWHITNLRNYGNLTPFTPNPVIASGITFAATGQGAGMVGLPGDTSPPSRFVKTALLLTTVFQVPDASGALNLAQHIINNVDIPLGLVREAKTGKAVNEYTQWVVFKDLTNRIFYYRTYGDLSLRAITFDKMSFAEDALHVKMPIAHKEWVQDVTAEFVGKKYQKSPPLLLPNPSPQRGEDGRRPGEGPLFPHHIPTLHILLHHHRMESVVCTHYNNGIFRIIEVDAYGLFIIPLSPAGADRAVVFYHPGALIILRSIFGFAGKLSHCFAVFAEIDGQRIRDVFAV